MKLRTVTWLNRLFALPREPCAGTPIAQVKVKALWAAEGTNLKLGVKRVIRYREIEPLSVALQYGNEQGRSAARKIVKVRRTYSIQASWCSKAWRHLFPRKRIHSGYLDGTRY